MKLNGLRFEVLSNDPQWWVAVFMSIKDGDSNGEISWKNFSDAEVIIDRGSQEIANGDYSNIFSSTRKCHCDFMNGFVGMYNAVVISVMS